MEEENTDIDVKVNVILKRQISQHLMGIYLPSIFIMVIAQVKMWDHNLVFISIQINFETYDYLPVGNPFLPERTFQNEHPSLYHGHAGHVHSQQLDCFKTTTNIKY